MNKKGIISLFLVVAVVGIGVAILWGERCNKESKPAIEDIVETKKTKVKVEDLHKDILRLIASEKEPVCGITQQDAEQELSRRAGNEPESDSKPADVKKLPFDIVKLIAKSPATIAGITPKTAINELVRRYLSIDLTDSEDVNSAVLLEALQHRGEKKAIEDWAKNEDAEAVEAFMKEEADKDPASVANFALGLRKFDSDPSLAKTYMNRYVSHLNSDSFDNLDEKKAFEELVSATKKLFNSSRKFN